MIFLFVWDWCISFTTSHFHQKLTYFTYTLSSMYTMTWASRLSWYKNNSYYKINMEKTWSWSKNRHWLINSNIDKLKRKTLGNEKEFGWWILKIVVLALKINENREIESAFCQAIFSFPLRKSENKKKYSVMKVKKTH